MNRAHLIECKLEVFSPVWSSASIQHYLLERRPVFLVFHVLAVRSANSVKKLKVKGVDIYTPPYKKADIALPRGNPTSELRDVTCHMISHSVTYHPKQVNAPRLTPSMQAGTRFTYPGGTEG